MNKDKQYKFCTDLIALKDEIEKNFLILGKGLMSVRDARLYDPAWHSFAEYCEELKLSESKASKLISIYSNFVLAFEIPEKKILSAGGWTVASKIATAVGDSKELSVKYLDLAAVLSQADLDKELNAHKTGTDEIVCLHPNLVELHFHYCDVCKMKRKIYSDGV
jgi:N-glycosylase/DNA lyase